MNISRKLVLTSTFIASALIFTGLATYRPGDTSHVVSVTNPEGGKAMHGAHFSYGINRCSVLVTSNVKLDRKEDLKISVEGKNPPPFQILGKNPSVLDIGIRRWPLVAGDTIRGVEKDKIAFYVVFSPPEKDLICDMWVDDQESGDVKEYKGKTYHFCSTDCRTVFAKEPAKFADKPLST
ncbi:MAG: YHS domain-containing protein, partial [Victivallales bacterium]